MFAVLIDPDDVSAKELDRLRHLIANSPVELVLVGGSLLTKNQLEETVSYLKRTISQPVIIFPGHNLHYSDHADALLFLSLLSGRNPEYLIGQHVVAAPTLKQSPLEVIPTGYILVDGGAPTTVSYMSNTSPVPANKPDIAMSTAIAGELLGMSAIYLDAGSGADHSVPVEMICQVRNNIDLPLIVGGGIQTPEQALERSRAGANVIVVGSAIEQDQNMLGKISEAIREKNQSVK